MRTHTGTLPDALSGRCVVLISDNSTMGNIHGHKSSHKSKTSVNSTEDVAAADVAASPVTPTSQAASIMKLFEKMELTADDGNTHPGELSRKTFENAFHGPLHKFGKLMFRQMKNGQDSDRITREEFVQAGTEIVCMVNLSAQRKYYFKLFSSGKEYMSSDEAMQMVHVSYMLTVSVSKIPHKHDDRDIQLFQGMVTSLFGTEDQVNCEKLDKWLLKHCPNMFSGVHSWVCMVLGGSNLPAEMEANTVCVPQLEDFTCGTHCLCLGMAWVLSAVLPNCYTTVPNQPTRASASHSTLFSSFHQLMANVARLPRVQSWSLLYSSEHNGMSNNRFSHHVLSYHGPILVFLCFEGDNQYCLALDTGFREGTQRFGGNDCRLIQLLPVYRVVQSGPKMVLFNNLSRTIPKGILIGQDSKPLVLRLDDDFDKIYHYDAPCTLHRIEAWGCGGEEVKQAQAQQKEWEARDTERQRTRKLRLEGDWRENPDKQILEWGGIRTGSSYLSNR